MTKPKCGQLFTPWKAGALQLSNRVVLAPLTRCRATTEGVPTSLMVDYYAQRSTPGCLLISEASPISAEGGGMRCTPGIYTQEQADAWRPIVDAVHQKGGLFVCQLWHMGRQSHSSYHPKEGLPVSSSATPMKGTSMATTKAGEQVPFEVPRALSTEEIPRLIGDYVHASKMAKAAGFDGVEIHGANAYLLDQFFHDGVNKRTDQYGGSIENRCRLACEVVEAVVKVWGADRVGIRLAPPVYLEDSDKKALFSHLVRQLDQYNLAYLHFVNGRCFVRWGIPLPAESLALDAAFFRPMYRGTIIDCGEYTKEMANDTLDRGDADLIAFGKVYIANPDLVYRLQRDLSLTAADMKSFYTPGPKGYTDYPVYEGEKEVKCPTEAG